MAMEYTVSLLIADERVGGAGQRGRVAELVERRRRDGAEPLADQARDGLQIEDQREAVDERLGRERDQFGV